MPANARYRTADSQHYNRISDLSDSRDAKIFQVQPTWRVEVWFRVELQLAETVRAEERSPDGSAQEQLATFDP